jgi:hypothetical protein
MHVGAQFPDGRPPSEPGDSSEAGDSGDSGADGSHKSRAPEGTFAFEDRTTVTRQTGRASLIARRSASATAPASRAGSM